MVLLIVKATLGARLVENMSWSLLPARSSVAGQVANLDSSDKSDRMVTPLGAGQSKVLDAAELDQVQRAVWAEDNEEYAAFITRFDSYKRRRRVHDPPAALPISVSQWRQSQRNHFSRNEVKWQTMPSEVTTFKRAQYAGNIFRAAPTQRDDLVHDDSHVRYDYNEQVH
jgi:hypothetical protein